MMELTITHQIDVLHNNMQSDQNARNGMVLSVSKGSFSAAHRNLLGVRSVP
jgi:hypothetical protein